MSFGSACFRAWIYLASTTLLRRYTKQSKPKTFVAHEVRGLAHLLRQRPEMDIILRCEPEHCRAITDIAMRYRVFLHRWANDGVSCPHNFQCQACKVANFDL